jgi:hypothetical protein
MRDLHAIVHVRQIKDVIRFLQSQPPGYKFEKN